MDREIPYRVWNKDQKEMSSPFWSEDLNNNVTGYYVNYGNGDYFDLDNDDIIFMKFTGLKDKNGKEIYEGDIVKTRVGNKKVKWLSIGWLVSLISKVEVIGNVFENKNLLNQKNEK